MMSTAQGVNNRCSIITYIGQPYEISNITKWGIQFYDEPCVAHLDYSCKLNIDDALSTSNMSHNIIK